MRHIEDAVACMTEAATQAGRTGLIMSASEWQALVHRHLDNPDISAFASDVIERVGPVDHADELNRRLSLATNVWNATPQPDRGGKTAYQLSRAELEQGERR